MIDANGETSTEDVAGAAEVVPVPAVDAPSMAAALRVVRCSSNNYDPSPTWQSLHVHSSSDDAHLYGLLRAASYLDCPALLARSAERLAFEIKSCIPDLAQLRGLFAKDATGGKSPAGARPS
jgi:hypothetical protein